MRFFESDKLKKKPQFIVYVELCLINIVDFSTK